MSIERRSEQKRLEPRPREYIARQHVYGCIANRMRLELITSALPIPRVEKSIAAKFRKPLLQYAGGFEVERSSADSAFELDQINKIIKLHTAGLDLMMNEVSERKMDRLSRRDIKKRCVELYVAHEVRHLSQGVAHFSDVQLLKASAGSHVLGNIDLLADIDAARIVAAILTQREETDSEYTYYRHLRDNVFIIGEFALKAFGAPLSKPHKVHRALGIAAMLARIDSALPHLRLRTTVVDNFKGFPLDTVILPVFSDEPGLSLLSLEPDYRILHPFIPVEREELVQLAEEIDAWPFNRSVMKFRDILVRAELV